jgi:hypothetical protein
MKQKLLTLAIACMSFTNVCQAAFPVDVAPVQEMVGSAGNQLVTNGVEMNNFNNAPIIRKTAPIKAKKSRNNDGTIVFGLLSFLLAVVGFAIAAAANSIPLVGVFGAIAAILGIIGVTGGKRLKGLAITGLIIGLFMFIAAVATPDPEY